jgi:hypothetical protein
LPACSELAEPIMPTLSWLGWLLNRPGRLPLSSALSRLGWLSSRPGRLPLLVPKST